MMPGHSTKEGVLIGRLRQWLVLGAVGLGCLLMLPSTVLAYNTFNDYKLLGGVGNYGANDRYYFICDGASPYASAIHDAIDGWVYTTSRLGVTTPISWLQTSVQTSSVMDLHASGWATRASGVIGATEFWKDGARMVPRGEAPDGNWAWTHIWINTNVYDTSDMACNGHTAAYNRIGTWSHEMGHAMGLAHVSSTSKVMCQLGGGRTVKLAQVDDCNGINHLY